MLTLNEADNVEGVVHSLRRVTDTVVVVDSFSSDGTVELARRSGAEVWQRAFDNYSDQRNWALRRIREVYRPAWILSLDADERLTDGLVSEMRRVLSGPQGDVYLLNLRLVFCGRELRYGGFQRTWLPRLFRAAGGQYEEREANEHFVPIGGARIERLAHPLIHLDVNSWARWIEKQNRYSSAEARNRLVQGPQSRVSLARAIREPWLRRRWMREHLLNRFPAKGWLRFVQVYILLGGFLDGRPGLRMAALVGWQEWITDLKYREMVGRESQPIQ